MKSEIKKIALSMAAGIFALSGAFGEETQTQKLEGQYEASQKIQQISIKNEMPDVIEVYVSKDGRKSGEPATVSGRGQTTMGSPIATIKDLNNVIITSARNPSVVPMQYRADADGKIKWDEARKTGTVTFYVRDKLGKSIGSIDVKLEFSSNTLKIIIPKLPESAKSV